jgi:hypothetical protein
MQRFGLRANLDKCYFFKENVTYCSHEIGSDGLKKSQDKIDAILKVKKPEKTLVGVNRKQFHGLFVHRQL